MNVAVFEPKFLTPRPNATSHLIMLRDQIEYFTKQGHQVSIFTEDSSSSESSDNYTIHPLHGNLSLFSPIFSAARTSIPVFPDFFSFDIISKALKIIRKSQIDIMYSCGSSYSALLPAIFGRILHIPTVHYVSSLVAQWRWWREEIDNMGYYKVPLKRIAKVFLTNAARELPRRDFIQRWSLDQTTKLIASSNYVKNALYKLNVEEKDISVVYPGVRMPPLRRDILTERPVITYFGHLWQGRGVLDLLVAFSRVVKKHPEAKLIVAATNIQELTEYYFSEVVNRLRLSANITRMGIVNDVFSELLKPSNIVVLPYRDIPSIKLIESMAAAKPIVTTKIGWVPELVTDGVSGFLVDVGDTEGIANKISILLDDVELAQEIGREARKMVEKQCSLKKNTSVISKIMEESVSPRA